MNTKQALQIITIIVLLGVFVLMLYGIVELQNIRYELQLLEPTQTNSVDILQQIIDNMRIIYETETGQRCLISVANDIPIMVCKDY